MSLNEMILRILCSVIGATLVILVQILIRFISEKRGAFTGKWENHIYNENGEIIKRDSLNVKQRGDLIHGFIKRFQPEDQSHRKWKMIGRIRGKDFFAIFWSRDPSIISYGCWYVHQKSDFRFEGYYLKFHEKSKYRIKPIRLDFVRSLKK